MLSQLRLFLVLALCLKGRIIHVFQTNHTELIFKPITKTNCKIELKFSH
jgi:hypothetical protein